MFGKKIHKNIRNAAAKPDNFSKSPINAKKSVGKSNDRRFDGVVVVPVTSAV